MELRTILAAGSGGAGVGTIEVACQLARQFNSHVEAFHVQLDPRYGRRDVRYQRGWARRSHARGGA